jgi:hypothetical protein
MGGSNNLIFFVLYVQLIICHLLATIILPLYAARLTIQDCPFPETFCNLIFQSDLVALAKSPQ